MPTHEYLVPDIYDSFSCLCGKCRATCCSGFEITISQADFLRLETLDCSAEMRRKLDDTVCVLDYPSYDKFAMLRHGWDGKCRLLNGDGLCSLQLECGEEIMQSTCRYYPRSMRSAYGYQAAMSCSCEAVVTQLMNKNDPLSFTRRQLTFDIPGEESAAVFPSRETFDNIRFTSIAILQDRTNDFTSRLIRLSAYIDSLEPYFENHDDEALSKQAQIVPVMPEISPISDADEILLALTDAFSGDKDDFAEYLISASGVLRETDFRSLSARYKKLTPAFDRYMEQIFVHHIFYSLWPMSSRSLTPVRSYLALTAEFLILSAAEICCYDKKQPDIRFCDICAAAFRNIENSNFDERAAAILSESGAGSVSEAAGLLDSLMR